MFFRNFSAICYRLSRRRSIGYNEISVWCTLWSGGYTHCNTRAQGKTSCPSFPTSRYCLMCGKTNTLQQSNEMWSAMCLKFNAARSDINNYLNGPTFNAFLMRWIAEVSCDTSDAKHASKNLWKKLYHKGQQLLHFSKGRIANVRWKAGTNARDAEMNSFEKFFPDYKGRF